MKNLNLNKPPNEDLLTTNVELALNPTNLSQKIESLVNVFKTTNLVTNPKGNGHVPNTILLSFLIVAYFTPDPSAWQVFILWFIVINKFMEWTLKTNNS